MGKNKMIAKSCPQCYTQVAVASKSCKCGHTFFSARRAADALPAVEEVRRRTSRVCRAQVQLYDAAAEHDKQKKLRNFLPRTLRLRNELPVEGLQYWGSSRKSPKKRSMSRSIDEDYKKDKSESATARARRRRALRRAQREAPPPGDRPRDPTPQLRHAQLATCALILQEINRKMQCVTWQPQT